MSLWKHVMAVSLLSFVLSSEKKDWHAILGGGVHADAIMDRIVHNTAWVEMGEFNMRQKIGTNQ